MLAYRSVVCLLCVFVAPSAIRVVGTWVKHRSVSTCIVSVLESGGRLRSPPVETLISDFVCVALQRSVKPSTLARLVHASSMSACPPEPLIASSSMRTEAPCVVSGGLPPLQRTPGAALALRRAEAGAVFAGAFTSRLARIASEVFGSSLSLELARV